MSRRELLMLLLAGLFASGCATPREINGRKVLRTLWQNGHIVYVLEEDKATKEKTRETAEATQGLVLQPLRASPAK